MDEEGIVYLTLCLVMLVVPLSILSLIAQKYLAIAVVLLVIAGGIVILLLNFADYLLVSAVFGLLGITFQPAQGYTIVKSQNAIVKNVNGLYYATGYVTANLFAYSLSFGDAP